MMMVGKTSLRAPSNYITEPVVALKRAPSGRPYAEWKSPTGRTSVYPAALLPDGYCAEITENGSKIYTCPVRDCEGTSLSMLHVDVHFMRNHSGQCFNDNLDGTLTLVGRRPGVVGTAIIISQKPLNTTDTEAREPPQTSTASIAILDAEDPVPTADAPLQKTTELGTVKPTSETSPSGGVAHRDHDREEHGSKDVGAMQTQIEKKDERAGVTGQGSPSSLQQTQKQERHQDNSRNHSLSVLGLASVVAHYLRRQADRSYADPARPKDNGIPPQAPAEIGPDVSPKPPEPPCETAKGASATVTSEHEIENEPQIVQERRHSIRLVKKLFEKEAQPPPADPDANTGSITKITAEPEKQTGPVPKTSRKKQHLDGEKRQEPVTPIPVSGLRRSTRKRNYLGAEPWWISHGFGGVKSPQKQAKKRKETPVTTPSRASKKRILDNASNVATSGSTEEDDDEIAARAAIGVVSQRTKLPFRRHNFHCDRRGSAAQQPTKDQCNAESSSSFPLPPSPADSSAIQEDSGGQASRPSFSSKLPPGSDADVFSDPLVPAAAQHQQQQTLVLRPRDGFELEDWEIAPGIIRRDGTNLAFSSAALRSNTPRPISTGLGVHTVVVHPGASYRVDTTTATAAAAADHQVVSVAAGKIRVRMSPPPSSSSSSGEGTDEVRARDGDDFTMNAHGIVVVRPGGGGCRIENRWAVDAVLTIVSVSPRQV